MNQYYTYILTNQNRTVLYIGVTSELKHRVSEHKAGIHPGFTKKYNVHQLVYFETYPDIKAAIDREKQLKGGSRQKKLDLINGFNKEWQDLFDQL
ncbi:GIY-YIG nuclease family protein [Hymenobacter taeanensis]|uniref:GIY-YIG nuclease family protein n=1 Tax=Hymenobacter taeanensis TaxID=2735321 RepID=A0A6M6BIW8_9BACT|nr:MULTISPECIES: GIY-YIG nuclease family protein [Hymenobacter]QJX47962.1 GIY-YIG nuclease family protein [Hymenobacter taeanensis]UOQ82591.1 GIY-YIG nuclease family protein [Hymenobacter sp. 5414T-23]